MSAWAELAAEAAPTGRLRVALNYGNAVLVKRGADADGATGVSVDLARALAERLGVAPTFIEFDRAGDVTASAGQDVWDLCFLAIDPLRAEQIAFSAPYVAIEGCYTVRADAPAASPTEVDAQRLKIGIVKGSAYALFLQRAASGAELVVFESAGEAVAALEAGDLDGIAGVRQAVERIAAGNPALRLIDEPFMAILQAVGVPAGRPRVAEAVAGFVAEMKANGFVAQALAASGHPTVRVPD